MAGIRTINQQKIQRPLGVWVITIFESLLMALVVLTFYSIFKGEIPPTVPIDMTDWTLTAVIAGSGLYAACLLFLLKKMAFKVFCAQFIFQVMVAVYHFLTKGLAGMGSLRDTLIGWTILAIVCKYVWDLKEKGVLN